MDIVTPSLDELLPKVDSRYTLVTLAAKRARQMLGEENSEDSGKRSKKNVTNAMVEIFEGKITYKRTKMTLK